MFPCLSHSVAGQNILLVLILATASFDQLKLVKTTTSLKSENPDVAFAKIALSSDSNNERKQSQPKIRTRLIPATRTKIDHYFPSLENKLKFKRSQQSLMSRRNRNGTERTAKKLALDNAYQMRVSGYGNGFRGIPSMNRIDPECSKVLDDLINNSDYQHASSKNVPLTCYQCSTSDPTDICDSWWEVRPSEKYDLRIACTVDQGYYCFKSITENVAGDRKIVRGCYGPGPLLTNLGNELKIREGCIRFYDDYHSLVTACFCEQNLCNHGEARTFQLLNITTVLLILLYFVSFYFKLEN